MNRQRTCVARMVEIEVGQEIRWFEDSPEAGDPHCVCSYCGERIETRPEDLEEYQEELNADEGEPIRMWTTNGEPTLEARFHPKCLNACLQLGLLTLGGNGA